jgi:hypothetical protein
MLGDSKKADDSKWVAPSLFDTRLADRLGRDGAADEAGEQQHGRGRRGTVVEPLFCNRAARVKDSKLELAPRMVVWQGPLFCPRSARAAAASWSQARARRINLRGCVVADRANPSVTTEAAELWSRAGSSTAVLNASAVTAPTPGTVVKQRHTWSCLATASTALRSNASWLMTAARVGDHASRPLRVKLSRRTES